MDLQRLRDDLLRQAGGLPDPFPTEKAAELLSSYAYSVELTLERGGVRVVRPAVGEPFDGARHRAVAAVPAPAAELDATVAAVAGDGYLEEHTGRTLAPAAVHVYRWERQGPPADQGDDAGCPTTS